VAKAQAVFASACGVNSGKIGIAWEETVAKSGISFKVSVA